MIDLLVCRHCGWVGEDAECDALIDPPVPGFEHEPEGEGAYDLVCPGCGTVADFEGHW